MQDGTDIIDWFEKQNMARLPAIRKPRATYCLADYGNVRRRGDVAGHALSLNLTKIILTSFCAIRAVCLPQLPENAAIWRFTADACAKLPLHLVSPETAPEIEAAYHDTMAELDAHFALHPYLLGGAPTIGDYGLFAHFMHIWGATCTPSA